MTSTMIEIAKEKDNGVFAKLGMQHYVATWFNVNINAPVVLEIVDTYLECIDNIDLDKWIYGLHSGGRPIIITYEELKSSYHDLLVVNNDLENITNLFMYLYDKEFYVDEISNCIYSTNYTDFERKKLNFVGIAMEYERLCTLHSTEMISWKDINSLIECLNAYGYDIEKDYKIRTNDVYETASRIEERLQDVFLL